MAKKADETKMSYAKQHGIPTVSLAEAKQQIMLTITSGQTRGCPVLVGDSGTGKTQIFQQIARELDYKLIVINVANWNLMSGGIPAIQQDDTEDGKHFFHVRVPDMFPRQGEKAILLFDELNRGTPAALATFFNIYEDRRIYDYKLPNSCIVAGTMNPATASYNVTPIEHEAAVRRRVLFMYVLPNFKAWRAHAKGTEFHAVSTVAEAKGKPCHPLILKFLDAQPSNIYDEKARDLHQSYACPSTWETTSEHLYLLAANDIKLASETARIRYAGSIGEQMANGLVEFIHNKTKELNALEILTNYESQRNTVLEFKGELNGKLGQASINVLTLLFSTQPDLPTVLPNLLQFWDDLPEDIAQGAIRGSYDEAVKQNAEPYFKQLMALLNDDSETGFCSQWSTFQLKLHQSVQSVTESITEKS